MTKHTHTHRTFLQLRMSSVELFESRLSTTVAQYASMPIHHSQLPSPGGSQRVDNVKLLDEAAGAPPLPTPYRSGGSSCCSDEVGLGDDDEEDAWWTPIPIRGTLSKWTNLLHGWQERYFILSDGRLTYYRNADDITNGSRGSIKIRQAEIKPHEYDDCRFEIRLGDYIWYLRCLNTTERQNWISTIDRHRVFDSGFGSAKTLNRPSSLVSLNSGRSPSLASASSLKRCHQLREKLSEMDTFK